MVRLCSLTAPLRANLPLRPPHSPPCAPGPPPFVRTILMRKPQLLPSHSTIHHIISPGMCPLAHDRFKSLNLCPSSKHMPSPISGFRPGPLLLRPAPVPSPATGFKPGSLILNTHPCALACKGLQACAPYPKHTPAPRLLWAKSLGGPLNLNIQLCALACDGSKA